MQRDDLQGVKVAPAAVQAHIKRRGGVNPFKEPMYRLIWGPNRVVKQGGVWHEWDKNLSINERGGVQYREQNGIIVPHVNKPNRIVAEVRLIHKYDFDGWVLERWVPSIMYPRYLYDARIPGTDVPLIGPYPEHGDYEMVAGGPGQTDTPEISWIDAAMSECEQLRTRHRNSTEQATLLRMNAAMEEYEKQLQKTEDRALEMLRDEHSLLFGTSLEAGRARNEIAARAGLKEHVGN